MKRVLISKAESDDREPGYCPECGSMREWSKDGYDEETGAPLYTAKCFTVGCRWYPNYGNYILDSLV